MKSLGIMAAKTRQRAAEVVMVVLALADGPRTGADLRDTLAVRMGSKARVTDAIARAEKGELVVREGPNRSRCRLSLLGIDEALRVLGKAAPAAELAGAA